MHVLLLYPVLPAHILQFRGSMARLGKKSFYPPMDLLTIAAILPQADDFHAQIKMTKARGIPVAVGGPYPTALPEEEANSGADFMVLNEGEITVPMFLQDLDAGATSGTYETEDKPDITETPIPRFELLDLDAYTALSVQFSRGCPFVCEFCDIITLYGRKARVKSASQMIAELDYIYQMGWRGVVSVIDDNFIANRRHGKFFFARVRTLDERKTLSVHVYY